MERFIKNLAQGAGAILREGYKKKVKAVGKTWRLDLVTKYDLLSNQYIISKIRKRFPRHGILSEETKGFKKKHKFWIIDPIDGTFCFSTHTGPFSVVIAYVEDDKIKHGVVYDPVQRELFSAAEGQGAYLNSKRIAVSSYQKIEGSSGYIWIYSNVLRKKDSQDILHKLFRHTFFPILLPSTTIYYAYMAMGRIDFVFGKGCYPWDYAAGALILKEAGAKVTEMDGAPFRWDSRSIVAANPVLHKNLIKIFKK